MKHLQLKDGDRLRRQCIGVDISKKKFTFCLCQSTEQDLHFYTKPKEFDNSETGFRHLLEWSGTEVDSSVPYSFLMETTGCYHESLALFLARKGMTVIIVHANKAKNFARLNGQRTKTDPVDSKMLATMGCDTPGLKPWPIPDEKYLQLRDMSRLSEQLEKTHAQVLCRMEATTHSGYVTKSVLRAHKSLLRSIEKVQVANEQHMAELVNGDPVIKAGVDNMESIKCIGKKTAVLVTAETLGFHQMTSAKQVASYAGLDVKKEQSGDTDKKGHMTKRGNAHLRAGLYFPAMVASWSNPQLMEDYKRICASHPQSKNIALVALERKLLCLMYSLWKSGKQWDPEYGQDKKQEEAMS